MLTISGTIEINWSFRLGELEFHKGSTESRLTNLKSPLDICKQVLHILGV